MKDNTTVEWAKVIVPAVIAVVGFAIGLWQRCSARRRGRVEGSGTSIKWAISAVEEFTTGSGDRS
jgi:hypothetical protein